MASHKAAFDAGEVERLVILVVVILGAEVFIPVAGHILLEESYKVFEKFEAVLAQFIAELAAGDDDAPVRVVAYALAVLPEADTDIQTSLVNTDADAILVLLTLNYIFIKFAHNAKLVNYLIRSTLTARTSRSL